MTPADLPPVFSLYHQMGGVIDFRAYDNVAALDEAVCVDAIARSVPGLDREALCAINCRTIDKRTFLGDWCDHRTGALIRRGKWRVADRDLENPLLVELDGVEIIAGGGDIPEPGSGGQFAYAFASPPYGLEASPNEVQRVFDAMGRFLFPPSAEHTILDWSDPRLPEASDYFRAGMEWWGVFLMAVYIPSFQRLIVISASTTD